MSPHDALTTMLTEMDKAVDAYGAMPDKQAVTDRLSSLAQNLRGFSADETSPANNPDFMDTAKQAYRQLARLVHPDANGNSPESQETMAQVNLAYGELTAPSLPGGIGQGQGTGLGTPGMDPSMQQDNSPSMPPFSPDVEQDATTGDRDFGMGGFMHGALNGLDRMFQGIKQGAATAHDGLGGIIDTLDKNSKKPQDRHAILGSFVQDIADKAFGADGGFNGLGEAVTRQLNDRHAEKHGKKPAGKTAETGDAPDAAPKPAAKTDHEASATMRASAKLSKNIGNLTSGLVTTFGGNTADTKKTVQTINQASGLVAEGLNLAANVNDLKQSAKGISSILKKSAAATGDKTTEQVAQVAGDGVEIAGEAAQSAIAHGDIVHGATAGVGATLKKMKVNGNLVDASTGLANIAADVTDLRVDQLAGDVIQTAESGAKLAQELPIVGGLFKAADKVLGFTKSLDSAAKFLQDPVGNTVNAVKNVANTLQNTVTSAADFLSNPFGLLGGQKKEGKEEKDESAQLLQKEENKKKQTSMAAGHGAAMVAADLKADAQEAAMEAKLLPAGQGANAPQLGSGMPQVAGLLGPGDAIAVTPEDNSLAGQLFAKFGQQEQAPEGSLLEDVNMNSVTVKAGAPTTPEAMQKKNENAATKANMAALTSARNDGNPFT